MLSCVEAIHISKSFFCGIWGEIRREGGKFLSFLLFNLKYLEKSLKKFITFFIFFFFSLNVSLWKWQCVVCKNRSCLRNISLWCSFRLSNFSHSPWMACINRALWHKHPTKNKLITAFNCTVTSFLHQAGLHLSFSHLVHPSHVRIWKSGQMFQPGLRSYDKGNRSENCQLLQKLQ